MDQVYVVFSGCSSDPLRRFGNRWKPVAASGEKQRFAFPWADGMKEAACRGVLIPAFFYLVSRQS
jgi:hypothetical protein